MAIKRCVRSRGLLIDRCTVLYISGAITPTVHNPSVEENIQRGIDVGARWHARGYTVFVPHVYHPKWLFSYEDFMTQDIQFLKRFDGIVMMRGWQLSRGAVEEYDYANANGIPVFFDEEFEKYNGKWKDLKTVYPKT